MLDYKECLELQCLKTTRLAQCWGGWRDDEEDKMTEDIIKYITQYIRYNVHGIHKIRPTSLIKLCSVEKDYDDCKTEDELKRMFLMELYSRTLSLPFDPDEIYEKLETEGVDSLEEDEVEYLIAQYGAVNYVFFNYLSSERVIDSYVSYQHWSWGEEN